MEVGKMNDNDIKDQIYLLSFLYRDEGYNERLDRTIIKLSREIIQQKVIADKDFMNLL